MASAPGRDESVAEFARRELSRRRQSLIERRWHNRSDGQELLGQVEPDWEDLAANQAAAANLDSQTEGELAELRRVVRALARLDQGRYGECASCGESIPEARLRALPETVYCAECAELVNAAGSSRAG